MQYFIECFAIIVLILAIFFVYMRAGKKKLALSVIPLMSVPAAHIIASLLLGFVPADYNAVVYVLVDMLGLICAAIFAGICSSTYRKKGRIVYLVISGVFDFVLACILVINNL